MDIRGFPKKQKKSKKTGRKQRKTIRESCNDSNMLGKKGRKKEK